MRIAVIDSSPLIHLAHLDLAVHLNSFFDVIYVSRSVQQEVNRIGRFRRRLTKLYRRSVFERCSVVDQANVDLMRIELDMGEAEALAQAPERNATFFIVDERAARDMASNKGLKVVGTARLLARLHLDGKAEDPRVLIRKLRRDLGFRIRDDVLEDAIAMASEPI